jgi:hypothetical protein
MPEFPVFNLLIQATATGIYDAGYGIFLYKITATGVFSIYML